MTISDLAERNPWWVDRSGIYRDHHIVEAEGSSIHWRPEVFKVADLEVDAIYTLRGPRQVGKTTLIKFLIKDLLDRVRDPRTILYLSCDPIGDRGELLETLIGYLRWIRRLVDDRVYIFLDEVTIIRDWQIAVKDLYDHGFLNKSVVVATGSHSIDVRKGGEQLPGRRGRYVPPADRELQPMSFPQYVEAYDKELYETIMKEIKESRDIVEKLNKMQLYLNRLSNLFDKYMITGGFPRPVDEYKKSGERSISIYPFNDMKYYIRGDIIKANKNPEIAEKVLNTIIEKMGTPIGYNTIAEEIGVDAKTAREYVETLEAMYLVITLNQPNPKTWEPEKKKRKKIYPRDPFIVHVVKHIFNEEWDASELAKKTVIEKQAEMLEAITVAHAKRAAKKTFYWRSKKGKEIDALIITQEKVIGIEVKQNIDKTKTTPTEKRMQAIPTKKQKIAIITGRGKQIEIKENTMKIPIEALLFVLKDLAK